MADPKNTDIKNILARVAERCRLKNWEYTVEEFDTKLNNYMGVLFPITLSGNCDEKPLVYRLVIKTSPKNENIEDFIRFMFAREVYVYSKILPVYEILQEDFPAKLKYIIPKAFYVNEEVEKEVMVIEDMRSIGYRHADCGTSFDYEHIISTLRTLGKLHALSMILEYKDKTLFDRHAKNCALIGGELFSKFSETLVNSLRTSVKIFNDYKYGMILNNLADNVERYFDYTLSSVKHLALCHCDVWKENLLFQYSKDNKPISACLIDYQLTRMSSPAHDFLSFMFSSVENNVRRQHYDDFLKIYYQSLEQMLNLAGLDAKEIYSEEDLKNDIVVVTPACLIMVNFSFVLWYGLIEDSLLTTNLISGNEHDKEEKTKIFRSRLSGIIDDFFDNNLI